MLATSMARDLGEANVTPLLVVANPRAGRGRAGARAEALARALEAAGVPFALATTNARGHATELAAGAAGTVVAVGGDGTVHEVLNGLVARDGHLGPLAVLPAGSGDDFAANAGCAPSIATLVARLRDGTTRAVDFGIARFATARGPAERRFANNAGLGFDAEVVREAHAGRRLRGRALYLAATLRALRRQRAVACDVVTTDRHGSTTVAGPVLFVSTCNGERVGGGLPFAPGARVDDGLLHVLRVTAPTRGATVSLLLRLLRRRHLADPRVRLDPGRRIDVLPHEPMPLALDGELVADAVTSLQLEVQAGRLLLVGTAAGQISARRGTSLRTGRVGFDLIKSTGAACEEGRSELP